MKKGWKATAQHRAKRMQVMDRQLRALGARYSIYRKLFESCMEALRAQAELIQYYENGPQDVEGE